MDPASTNLVWQGFNAVRMLKMRLIKGLANQKKVFFQFF